MCLIIAPQVKSDLLAGPLGVNLHLCRLFCFFLFFPSQTLSLSARNISSGLDWMGRLWKHDAQHSPNNNLRCYLPGCVSISPCGTMRHILQSYSKMGINLIGYLMQLKGIWKHFECKLIHRPWQHSPLADLRLRQADDNSSSELGSGRGEWPWW